MPSSVITSLSTSSRGTNTSGNSHSTARSPSPTIARYASASAAKPPTNGVKATPPLPLDLGPTRDFCNCFWGLDDAGANVLFSRMRTATQTITELEDFWRDRARIEEEYAAKLKALGSRVLGKEETGQFKLSLDTLATETSTQATAHAQFAALVKSELLASISAYAEKQAADAAQVQAPLEARYKTKHTAESAIMKAREKYESNCLRLASYTQQMAVNPGKDVERLQMKIARSQQTVTSNEKELETAVKAIREATVRWQKDWKEWCDLCQDMEEERLDYVKDVIWGYANAVSTLCVSDDQSCERIRVSLDQVDAFQDVESFVEECGTGIAIPAPPSWATFSPSNTNGLSPPPVQSASFTRVSARPAVPPSEQPPIKTTRNSRETSRESSSSPPVVPVKPAMAINTENGINHSIPKNIPPAPADSADAAVLGL
ncbi:SH3-domain-containing protein [Mycena indigotica]|uniref:SH3-domain-containing protein n=1 Tax=Mycena indigotica TaxID=2126181 RepID=A0A8H6SGL9_9AGAR|nr:SH3-domain-containing protein [Mycena indigotica]KAF7297475.1 SH3-domain-containing protein [Mycena indigotica]